MSLGYTISAMIFAITCSAIWLSMGNSISSAFTLYLFSGQVAMLALVGRAVLQYRHLPALTR